LAAGVVEDASCLTFLLSGVRTVGALGDLGKRAARKY